MKKVRVLGLCGSPRKKATFHALSIALESAAKEGVEVEMISLANKKMNYCIHCNHCKKDDYAGVCIYNDDIDEMQEKFLTADA